MTRYFSYQRTETYKITNAGFIAEERRVPGQTGVTVTVNDATEII